MKKMVDNLEVAHHFLHALAANGQMGCTIAIFS
jgi:hypothetical protein